MASVTSLDRDLKRMRLDKYTPGAANEIRSWIEGVLGEKIPDGDLLDALKNGVVLCKLVNLAIPPPGVKCKQSAMPFVQMENISHFLRACQSPPLNLQPHDVFLTVDLFEKKDPAQVIQCLGAFSRAANKIEPAKFPTAIGGRSAAATTLSPQRTGTPTVTINRGRGNSNASNGSSGNQPNALKPHATGGSNSSNTGWRSPTRTPLSPSVSSWSKKHEEGATSPAWNIAQYGYMGGASQGSMGISFGGRRQITSAGPQVPSLYEKEKKRKEQEAEKERLRVVAEEAEKQRLREREAEHEAAKRAEEEKWAEETRIAREKAHAEAEEEKRRWEEEERRWKQDEEARQREEREAEAKIQKERARARTNSDARLQGQFLSQYQSEQGISRGSSHASQDPSSRVAELERELALARERERQYERERQERISGRSHQVIEDHDFSQRMKESRPKSRTRSRSRSHAQQSRPQSRATEDEAWRENERDYLRKQWSNQHGDERPMTPVRVTANTTGPSARPLPDPATYTSPTTDVLSGYFSSPEQPKRESRTERYLSSNPAPQQSPAKQTYSSEIGGFDSTAERDAEDRRRKESQTKTRALGWASKSLLEREMELERQRQQDWEAEQKRVAARKTNGNGVDGIGGGIDGSHDISQWSSYTRGDGGNNGSLGIGAGRRQIVGPRPPPGR